MPLRKVYHCQNFDVRTLISYDLSPFFWYTYILLHVDYVSKSVEVVAIRVDDTKTMAKYVKSHILPRNGKIY